jgi:hypothetical protein
MPTTEAGLTGFEIVNWLGMLVAGNDSKEMKLKARIRRS